MTNAKTPDVEKDQTLPVFWGAHSILILFLVIIGLLLIPVTAIPGENPAEPVLMGENNSFNLKLVVKNTDTGAGIAGARIYLDGGYQGVTSGNEGRLTLGSVARGEHSIRAVKSGFLENSIQVHIPNDEWAVIQLHASKIIPVGNHGPEGERIDIVFVPSETQYDCVNVAKINTDYYTANEENFKADVHRLIQNDFFGLDNLTAKSVALPENFRDRFNFYYYWDPGNFADAFQDCAGTLPAGFWDDAPFTDVAIIIYPTYGGYYKGPPCEPSGCASSRGPGVRAWFKISVDSGITFIHEAGHVVFGLIDTYCGETYYVQNDPYPNVWNSLSGCVLTSESSQWNPAACRQIEQPAKKGYKAACQKNFWRWDPDPDIMGSSSTSGKFGNASTLRIRYVFDNINRWKL